MDAALNSLTSPQELADRIRDAAASRTPLSIVGGGSKAFYGRVCDGQPLPTSGLQGILSYEPSELVVTVAAGTTLCELEAALAAQGQALAFEPPHFAQQGRQATVGGMVAAGLSGPARASVGAVRDYVLGLEMINGQGELLRYGGQVMKNVAGYDVSRLLAGSWGTLGLITEVSLKVLPVAPAEASLRFDECSQEQAVQWLNAWGGQPLPLNASCWLQQPGQAPGSLYLRLRGAEAAVQAACLRLGGERLDAQTLDGLWQACREQTLPWFSNRQPGHGLWRLSLPATTAALALPAGCVGPLVEWHGAQRWVQAPCSAQAQLQALAQAAGGSATLFRGDAGMAVSDASLLEHSNPAIMQLQRRLKQAFDPAGILNPLRAHTHW